MSKNQPEIRFKGFTDTWELRKLSDLGKVSTGKAFSSLDFDVNGNYLVITNKDISDSSRSKNVITDRINISNRQIIDKYILRGENILVTMDGVNLGKTAMYSNNSALLAQRVGRIQSSQIDFLYQITSNPEFLSRMRTLAVGNAIKHISLNQIASYTSIVPICEDEKKMMGNFFNELNKNIALYQRKLDLLKEQKQGFLQQLFPKNGETEPELRFGGFANAWELRKLGELANIVRGASPRPIQNPKWFDDSSEVGWLRISDVTEQNGRINHLQQRISKAGQEKTRVLNEPHLLLSIAATVGKPVINYVKTGVHDGFLIFLNPIFEQEFLFQWLEMFRSSWKKYGQPGSQINLNSELVRNQEIKIPNNTEQVKISKFFKSLDDTITLHQRKLDKFKEIKKGYLQKMFV